MVVQVVPCLHVEGKDIMEQRLSHVNLSYDSNDLLGGIEMNVRLRSLPGVFQVECMTDTRHQLTAIVKSLSLHHLLRNSIIMKNRLIEMTLLFQLENTALYIQLSWFL